MVSELTVEALRDRLLELHASRRRRHKEAPRPRRESLSPMQRAHVLEKTARRCHICGGLLDGKAWSADHVLAHASGGSSTEENFLPAHGLCNHLRWDYGEEEFQLILKIGVWARTQMARDSSLGTAMTHAFVAKENALPARRERARLKRQPPAGTGG